MNLVIQHSHSTIGCANGVQKYMNHIRFSGFNSVNLAGLVTESIKFCRLCPTVKIILTKTDPAQALASRFLRGPDDFLSQTLSTNPLLCMQIDELGPWYPGNQHGFTKI